MIIPFITLIWYNSIATLCLYKGLVHKKREHLIHSIVCFTNSFCSILQIANLDIIYVNDQHIKYLRYVEWTICSPLMILELAIILKLSIFQNITLIILTLSFCICGSIAALPIKLWIKIYLGTQGTFFSGIIILYIWKVIYDKKFNNDNISIPLLTLISTTLIWPCFVLTWGLGPDIFHIINTHQEFLAQTILSIILKTSAVYYSTFMQEDQIETYIDYLFSFF